jgi:DNA polymerase-3 subunit beta
VLLETSKAGITGSATDLYQSVVSSVAADVADPGGVAVNARDLLDRVKSLPDGPVSMVRDGVKLRVSSGKRKHALPIVPPEEFPKVPSAVVSGLTVPGNILVGLLQRTKPMAAVEPDRPAIHGVLFEFGAGKLWATSTDSRRLSLCWDIVTDCKAAPAIIVPLEAVDALIGLIDASAPVIIGMVGQELGFQLGADLFTTKLVEGQFPPVKQICATPPKSYEFIVPRQALAESLLSTEKATEGLVRGIVLVTLAPGVIRLRADGKGAAEDELDVGYEGPEITVGLHAKYVLDALTAIGTPDIRVNLGADLGPCWFRSPDGDATTQIVMPTIQGQPS